MTIGDPVHVLYYHTLQDNHDHLKAPITSSILYSFMDTFLCEYDYNDTYVRTFHAYLDQDVLGQCLQFDRRAHKWCGFM